MYSLDINFLKDRNLTSDTPAVAEKASPKTLKPSGQEPLPLIGGGVVAAIALGCAGFIYWQATETKTKTQARIVEVDTQIQQFNAQDARVQQLQQEIDGLKSQSQAFVEVLQTKIKPWSAILEEVSDLTPPALQINGFNQTEDKVLVTGYARDFNAVNDFTINLQASPLFIGDEIFIVKAALVDNPTTVEFKRPVESYSLPKVVEYTISLTLKDLTNAEIIKTLESQGARGMAERLKKSF